MLLTPKIEALLLVSIRPISVKELMDKLEVKKKEAIEAALEELTAKYNVENSGITIQRIDDKVQMVSAKEQSEMISEFLKSEVSGELTPASLETLTVIAYRGPISKSELELIRGVNCSMILRNLLIRGLIEEMKSGNDLSPKYQITFDFLRYLGIASVKDLPDFDKLNSDENLKNLLNLPQEVDQGQVSIVPKSDIQELPEIVELQGKDSDKSMDQISKGEDDDDNDDNDDE